MKYVILILLGFLSSSVSAQDQTQEDPDGFFPRMKSALISQCRATNSSINRVRSEDSVYSYCRIQMDEAVTIHLWNEDSVKTIYWFEHDSNIQRFRQQAYSSLMDFRILSSSQFCVFDDEIRIIDNNTTEDLSREESWILGWRTGRILIIHATRAMC